MKIDKPNFTQIPNILLDNIDKFTHCEFKIIIFICRKTFGWHKEKDRIAYSQILNGTGLSKNTIPRSIKTLKESGYLIQTGSPHKGYSYELVIDGLYPQGVQSIPTMGTINEETVPTMGTTKEKEKKLSKENSGEPPLTPDEKEFKVHTQKLVDYIYQIHKHRKTLPLGKTAMDKFINSNRSTAKTILSTYQKEDINDVLKWIVDHEYWEDGFNHLNQFATVYGQYKNTVKKEYNYAKN